MFLAWFWDSKLSGLTFNGKIAKILVYDKGFTVDYDSPELTWDPKLVYYEINIFIQNKVCR